jgi:hypothetical protein
MIHHRKKKIAQAVRLLFELQLNTICIQEQSVA